MRAELLTGEQEKDLAVMVQDLLHLEQVARDLAVKLGRTPSDMEWMEAADAQGDFEDITTALTGFQQRVHAGRSAKQVCVLQTWAQAGVARRDVAASAWQDNLFSLVLAGVKTCVMLAETGCCSWCGIAE